MTAIISITTTDNATKYTVVQYGKEGRKRVRESKHEMQPGEQQNFHLNEDMHLEVLADDKPVAGVEPTEA
jgi:hypothetical protein